MSIVVVFTSNNARIIYAEDVTPYAGLSNCVINPDLTLVKGLPPHCWKIVDGVIAPKTAEEIKSTEEQHTTKGVDNNVTKAVIEAKTTSIPWGTIALVLLTIAAIAKVILCLKK